MLLIAEARKYTDGEIEQKVAKLSRGQPEREQTKISSSLIDLGRDCPFGPARG
jgi:hypothetical protein